MCGVCARACVLWNLLRVRAEDGLLPAAILDFRG